LIISSLSKNENSSTNGAMAFAVIRSVIDTAIKNSQNVWGELNYIVTVSE
jgi:hypothetical protein